MPVGFICTVYTLVYINWAWLLLDGLCSIFHEVFENDMKIEVCNSSTAQSKYSNCTINPSKYIEEICFHHHCQAYLI